MPPGVKYRLIGKYTNLGKSGGLYLNLDLSMNLSKILSSADHNFLTCQINCMTFLGTWKGAEKGVGGAWEGEEDNQC